ncbi:uncharacterized protein GV1 [Tenebrio molitor]|uniref:uncharacterized protein GV1 n=1 Tax=Tenebrio molitor TaxID=7067 RepID=UPI003624821D
MAFALNTIALLCLMTLASAKPIMVTFGTNQGPIEPPETTSKPIPRTLDNRNPAPVSEQPDDVPNSQTYRPPVPHQYRTKIYAQRPPPTLILGTPIDRKFTPEVNKYDAYKKQGRVVGVEYTGPHVFEKQEYEVLEEKRARPVWYPRPHYQQVQPQQQQQQQKAVPEIGIVYSAGVRYYVPQIVYVQPRQEEEQENSVYDHKDEKLYYRKGGQ